MGLIRRMLIINLIFNFCTNSEQVIVKKKHGMVFSCKNIHYVDCKVPVLIFFC